jgi:tripartite-type tricarboxylate transporter receptor subunit TctC
VKRLIAILAGAVMLWPAVATAQSWPTRTVTLVVPFAPGGSVDVTARLLATKLSEATKQSFVVENQAGGGSVIGTQFVAKAPADGYTLLMTSSALAITPHLNKLSYDPLKDLAPVAQLIDTHGVLLVAPNSPYKSVKELFDDLKAQPGELSYGSAGNGSGTHLWVEGMLNQAGLKAVHIPYKGAGPAKTAAMAGEIDFITDAIGAAMGQITGKTLVPLAVLSKDRDPALPDAPTLSETVLPGFDFGSWVALLAPAGTPAEVVDAINAAFLKAMDQADTKEFLKKQGLISAVSSPAELGTLMKTEIDRYGTLVKTAGIKGE